MSNRPRFNAADVTASLQKWVDGDEAALEQLTPVIYPELRSIARAYLRRAGRRDAIETTEVVSELFVRLLSLKPAPLQSRRHFYALSARIIRMALVDTYRHERAERRGGDRDRIPMHDELAWVDAGGADVLAFDLALRELEQLDPELAELVNLRFVLGCTAAEAADISGLSKATVDRKIRLARAWLRQHLGEAP